MNNNIDLNFGICQDVHIEKNEGQRISFIITFLSYTFKKFCETRSKRNVEVYKGRNLHPPPSPPPTDVTDILIGI